MYKVFVNDKPLFIGNSLNHHKQSDDVIFHQYENRESLDDALSLLKAKGKDAIKALYLTGDERLILSELYDKFKLIEAAGGIVVNPENEILMIHRRDKWDLPKGKIDPGETAEQAAIREISEECGISGHRITDKFPDTFHIYREHGEDILKKCHWFLFDIDDKPELIPQAEEDIAQAVWLKKPEVEHVIHDAYASVRETIKAYFHRKE